MPDIGSPLRRRSLAETDLAGAHRLSSMFGWPHRLEDWRMMLGLGAGVAVDDEDGRLVATGLRWLVAPRLATLGMILVDPAWHRRGIGCRLLRALIAGAETAGAHTSGATGLLLHATEAGQALYAAHGFRGIGMARQLQGLCRGPVSAPDVRPAGLDDHGFINALDAMAFGSPRERLLATLLAAGEAMVLETEGRISGFAIRRAFGRGTLIGPVVAPRVEDALRLVAATVVSGFNRIDIADDAAGVTRTLAGLGLVDAGTVVPMARGNWPPAPRGAIRFALASQAFG